MKFYNQLLLQGLAGIILRLTIVSAQRRTCAIIKVECCVCIPGLSGYISATLDDMKGQVKGRWWSSFLDFSPILGEGWLVENYIYHCYSCLDRSALWAFYFTMFYELCNPKVDVVLPNWRSESQGAIYPYEWCSYYELRASRGGNEGGNRQNRLHLESRTPSWAGPWTLSCMPRIYGNDIPTGKPGPLGGRAPGFTPRLSVT